MKARDLAEALKLYHKLEELNNWEKYIRNLCDVSGVQYIRRFVPSPEEKLKHNLTDHFTLSFMSPVNQALEEVRDRTANVLEKLKTLDVEL